MPVAVTVTVDVTLVPVVALLVDMLVETVETDANTAGDINNSPTSESTITACLFITSNPYGLNTSPI